MMQENGDAREPKEGWESYFPDRLTPSGFCGSVNWHGAVLGHVRRLASPGRRLLEVGCGLGAPAIWLSDIGYEVYGVDLSQSLISRANEGARLWGTPCSFMPMDMFHLGFRDGAFDVAYNHGVLEHFDDKGIRAAIGEMLRVAATAVVSVPTIHHPTWDFGNERLMPVSRWLEILRPFHVAEVDGWDYTPSSRHEVFRAYAVLARRVFPKHTNWWHTVLFARQAVFVLSQH